MTAIICYVLLSQYFIKMEKTTPFLTYPMDLSDFVQIKKVLPLKECIWTIKEWQNKNIGEAITMTNFSRYIVEDLENGLKIWYCSAWYGNYELIAENHRFKNYDFYEMNLGSDAIRYALFIEKGSKYYDFAKKILNRYFLKETKKECEVAIEKCGFVKVSQ